MRRLPLLVFAAALLAASGLAACGGNDGDDGRPSVAVTTGVLAAIVGEIAADDSRLVELIPDGASPHAFQFSAKDRRNVAEADLMVRVGGGLEPRIPLGGTPAWELVEHAGPLRRLGEEGHADEGDGHADEGDGHADEESDGRDSGGNDADPHVWMDPTRVARALPSLARALGRADPPNADRYRERARDYAEHLREIDRRIKGMLEPLSPGRRKLVTSHDALGYFADRYEFEVVATVFPAGGADAEAGAGRLRDVIEAVREARVPALFAQREDDPKVLRRVAAATGARVVDDLLVESPGPAGSYHRMLLTDASKVLQALRR